MFDEIDQALDPVHRQAVAQLVTRQAHDEEHPAQFITSTFRPELVQVADKFYGVVQQNKESSVVSMTRHDAIEFVESKLNL